jgi:hypothetical protein
VNGVATWKGGEWAGKSNVLSGSRGLKLLRRRNTSTVRSNVQAASLVVDTVGASAGGDGVVESILVLPALEVIGVKAKAGSITGGIDKAVIVFD